MPTDRWKKLRSSVISEPGDSPPRFGGRAIASSKTSFKKQGVYELEGTAEDDKGTVYATVGEIRFQPRASVAGSTVELQGGKPCVISAGTWDDESVSFELRMPGVEDLYKYEGEFKGLSLFGLELEGRWQRKAWPSDPLRDHVPPNERGRFHFKLKGPRKAGEAKLSVLQKAAELGWNPAARIPAKGGQPREYRVHIITGNEAESDTDARVSLVLEGQAGKSQDTPLDVLCYSQTKPHAELFQAGQEDTFLIRCDEPLGQLTSVRLKHDNSGFSPAWHVSRVEVVDLESQMWSVFACGSWLQWQEKPAKGATENSTIKMLTITSMDVSGHDKLQADHDMAKNKLANLEVEYNQLKLLYERVSMSSRHREEYDRKSIAESKKELTTSQERLRKEQAAAQLNHRKCLQAIHEAEEQKQTLLLKQKEYDALEAKSAEVESLLPESRQKYASLVEQWESLKQETIEVEQHQANLEKGLQDLKNKFKSANEELMGKIAEQQSQSHAHREKFKEVAAQCARSKLEMEKMLEHCQQLVVEKTQLEALVQEGTAEKAELGAKVAELRRALDVEIEQSTGLQGELDTMAEKINMQKEQLHAAEHELMATVEGRDSALKSNNDTLEKIAMLKGEIEVLKEQRETLNQKVEEASKGLPELEAENARWEASIEEASKRLSTTKNLHSNMRRVILELLTQARDLLALQTRPETVTQFAWDRDSLALGKILHNLLGYRKRLKVFSRRLLRTPGDYKFSEEEHAALSRLNDTDHVFLLSSKYDYLDEAVMTMQHFSMHASPSLSPPKPSPPSSPTSPRKAAYHLDVGDVHEVDEDDESPFSQRQFSGGGVAHEANMDPQRPSSGYAAVPYSRESSLDNKALRPKSAPIHEPHEAACLSGPRSCKSGSVRSTSPGKEFKARSSRSVSPGALPAEYTYADTQGAQMIRMMQEEYTGKVPGKAGSTARPPLSQLRSRPSTAAAVFTRNAESISAKARPRDKTGTVPQRQRPVSSHHNSRSDIINAPPKSLSGAEVDPTGSEMGKAHYVVGQVERPRLSRLGEHTKLLQAASAS